MVSLEILFILNLVIKSLISFLNY